MASPHFPNDFVARQESEECRPVLCGSNSVVECKLPKLDVVGSSPIARSKPPNGGFFVGLAGPAASPP